MTGLEQGLITLVVALISGIIGNYVGSWNSVKNSVCSERRNSCQSLLAEKLISMEKKIDALTKLVDSKLLGI